MRSTLHELPELVAKWRADGLALALVADYTNGKEQNSRKIELENKTDQEMVDAIMAEMQPGAAYKIRAKRGDFSHCKGGVRTVSARQWASDADAETPGPPTLIPVRELATAPKNEGTNVAIAAMVASHRDMMSFLTATRAQDVARVDSLMADYQELTEFNAELVIDRHIAEFDARWKPDDILDFLQAIVHAGFEGKPLFQVMGSKIKSVIGDGIERIRARRRHGQADKED